MVDPCRTEKSNSMSVRQATKLQLQGTTRMNSLISDKKVAKCLGHANEKLKMFS